MPATRPLPATRSAARTPPALPERYRPLERIGVGGIGEVWRATDLNLERDLAVKVLRADRRTPDHAARLVREALLTGRLQHPGVPPVVERGESLDDAAASPFFAMKLVGGRTLRQMLRGKPRPDQARLLGVFRQVCEAVGFAHANGVIHRDIKPANVMVGDHGEVQVMDWGMARLLKEPDDESSLLSSFSEQWTAPTPPTPALQESGPAEPSVHAHGDETVLTPGLTATDDDNADEFNDGGPHTLGPSDSYTDAPSGDKSTTRTPGTGPTVADAMATMTVAGFGFGTPAYMPPEQARGETDRIDARSDVFGLGAVLCVILTRQAPFEAGDALDSLRKAAAADLGPAFAWLDACGADAPLTDLCRRCLSPDPADRPANGAAVADAIRDYENGVREKLEQERADRAAAEVRVVEERKRRRVGVAALAALLVAGVAGTLWYDAADRLGVVREERAVAQAARIQAVKARQEEESARIEAEAARRAAVRAEGDSERRRLLAEAAQRVAAAAETRARAAAAQSEAAAKTAEQERLQAEMRRDEAVQAVALAEKGKAEALAAAEAARQEREALAAAETAAEVRRLVDQATVRRDAGQYAAAADLLDAAARLAPTADEQLSPNLLRDARRHLTVAADLENARLPRAGADASQDAGQPRNVVAAPDAGDRFAAIFDAYGLDVLGGAPETSGRAVAASPVAPALLAGLDEWARAAAKAGDADASRRLRAVAAAADPTPLREALAAGESGRVTRLLLTEVSPREVPPQTAALVAHLLAADESPRVQAAATLWLDVSIDVHPGDYWLRRLRAEFAGEGAAESRRRVESLLVAAALRPDAVEGRFALALALEDADRQSEAAAEYRQVAEAAGATEAAFARVATRRLAALNLPAPGTPVAQAVPNPAALPARSSTKSFIVPAPELPLQESNTDDEAPTLSGWAQAAGLGEQDLPPAPETP
ncbi:serine/threonine-protein kinase [Alienimonas californiensis]|uniref:Serine/threonine-protein kinase PknB n=1 Tax=Alienimonas californiensis TaxID=2527989 RepID=A0A517P5C8_9PLAN|nr:serine/threonine-protein kinase [Alienimonas californiensis]QDT14555.1 Serine/threonine-protein kinase PknB [Alienimonas californiensis]